MREIVFFPNNKSVDFCAFHIPLIWFIMKLAISFEWKERLFIKSKENIFVYIRKLSTLIFLTQRIFIFGFEKLDKIILFLQERHILPLSR